MATHSSIFAWRIPRTEEPGGLQSMGRKETRLNTHMHTHLDDLEEEGRWVFGLREGRWKSH